MADTATRLRNFLKSNAAVKQRLGERIYFNRAPTFEGKPYLYYRRVTADNPDTLDATAGEDCYSELFEVEVVSNVEAEAEAIADLIIKDDNSGLAMSDYRGTFDDTTVRGIFVTNRESSHTPLGIGETTGLWSVAFNAEVHL